MQPERPVVAIDVDGVLFPWLKPEYGPMLLALADRAELVWASSGWGESANWHIGPHIGLPELPVIEFPTLVKLPAIGDWCGTRPLAWIDDWFTAGDGSALQACAWAQARPEPTLLVEVYSGEGLKPSHCQRVSAWLDDLRQHGRAA